MSRLYPSRIVEMVKVQLHDLHSQFGLEDFDQLCATFERDMAEHVPDMAIFQSVRPRVLQRK